MSRKSGSGREGLRAPNSMGLIVTGNLFDRNDRKPNGQQPHQVWICLTGGRRRIAFGVEFLRPESGE